MARTYRVNAANRIANRVFALMIRRGKGNPYRYLLTVVGRKSGTPRTTPVDIMRNGDERWLVAAYGVTNWVRNARAAGEVTISRGGNDETLRVVELGPEESVPVLRQYLREVPITQPYFDVRPSSSDAEIAAEADRHPVFRLEAVS
jgi:deazaflavin-dependent oxidoreductase (nitroreductase family)